MRKVDGRVPPDIPPYAMGGWVRDLPDDERMDLQRKSVEVLAGVHAIDITDGKADFLEPDPDSVTHRCAATSRRNRRITSGRARGRAAASPPLSGRSTGSNEIGRRTREQRQSRGVTAGSATSCMPPTGLIRSPFSTGRWPRSLPLVSTLAGCASSINSSRRSSASTRYRRCHRCCGPRMSEPSTATRSGIDVGDLRFEVALLSASSRGRS